jgi:hypothetical protein
VILRTRDESSRDCGRPVGFFAALLMEGDFVGLPFVGMPSR